MLRISRLLRNPHMVMIGSPEFLIFTASITPGPPELSSNDRYIESVEYVPGHWKTRKSLVVTTSQSINAQPTNNSIKEGKSQ